MFSIFKKASTEQDVVLRDLSEEQLLQVAGGTSDGDNDADDWKHHSHKAHKAHKSHYHKHHHHHHHHHHHCSY
jgi:hypothetical protein